MMTFKFLLPLMAVLCLCAPGVAAYDPILLVTPDGYYLLPLDDNGVPGEPKKFGKVVVVGDAPDPTPDPEPKDQIAEQVRSWAQQVNHPEGAAAIAVVYQTVLEAVRKDQIKPDDAFEAIAQGTDGVLPHVGGAERWVQFRSNLSGLINDKARKGELGTKQEIVDLLAAVHEGLTSSTPGGAEAALGDARLQLILQIVLLIIQLFTGNGGGTGGDGPISV